MNVSIISTVSSGLSAVVTSAGQGASLVPATCWMLWEIPPLLGNQAIDPIAERNFAFLAEDEATLELKNGDVASAAFGMVAFIVFNLVIGKRMSGAQPVVM